MIIDIKLNVQTIVLVGVIGGLGVVLNKKSAKIAALKKENEELRNAVNPVA